MITKRLYGDFQTPPSIKVSHAKVLIYFFRNLQVWTLKWEISLFWALSRGREYKLHVSERGGWHYLPFVFNTCRLYKANRVYPLLFHFFQRWESNTRLGTDRKYMPSIWVLGVNQGFKLRRVLFFCHGNEAITFFIWRGYKVKRMRGEIDLLECMSGMSVLKGVGVSSDNSV
jgi:hypothetical protein